MKELNEEVKDAVGEITKGCNTDGDHGEKPYHIPYDNLPHNRHSL